ncbi:amino acid adenylation domain-containing protein [Sorangium sp. So ce429]
MLARAVVELREMRQKLDTIELAKREPIAIVGMACRMPGASDPESFWELLRDGRDAIVEIPSTRWDVDGFYDPSPDARGKMYTRRGGFIDDVDLFDARFFGISPREAAYMDPQQRMFLEVSWEALERAGQAPDSLAGSQTGVFVGVTTFDYAQLQSQRIAAAELDAYALTGNASTFAAGRLSYWLGLHGPSMSVDTACSSSLVAVNLACQSLRAGECTMAIAGGVNALLSPEVFVVLSKARMMAADGRCKTFDRAADGYVRGEGCGVVVLKRLSDALANNDSILALIRGSAVNHDGRSSGITVPNARAQQAVIRQALRAAGIAPAQVSYVEAHGTGTSLGDPIEASAVSAVLSEGRRRDDPVAIGSVKTNIGHLEAAAGIAGLIKVVLSMNNQQIPPSLHVQEVNPEIPLDELQLTIPTATTSWPSTGRPRVAGLSSFGASGTNAHLVIEEPPAEQPAPREALRTHHLLTLSAKSPEALAVLARRYHQHLTSTRDESLSDVCFTTSSGRAHFNHRLAVVAESPAQMAAELASVASGQAGEATMMGQVNVGSRVKVAFLFSGQGCQYAGMGRVLYETQPSFRRTLDQCDELLRPYLERPLLSVLYPPSGEKSPIEETAYTQPALFALEVALACLWRSWGVEPSVLIGHSIGEYVAACVAGVYSLEEGIMLTARRGQLMQAQRSGAMASVLAGHDRVAEALVPYARSLSIAAVNGPESTVISGEADALRELLEGLAAQGVKWKPLAVSHAFHSPMMDPMLDEFEKVAREVSYARPRIPVVSNVTGQLMGEDGYSARYWREHLRAPVRFHAGMNTLHEQGYTTFLEIGPAPTLAGMAKSYARDTSTRWLPSLRKGQDDWRCLLGSLGRLYTDGLDVDWERVHGDYPRKRVVLPTYPFQRQKYWYPESTGAKEQPKATEVASPASPPQQPPSLLGVRLPSPLDAIQFASEFCADQHPCLGECIVDGLVGVNIGVYLDMAFQAAGEIYGAGPRHVQELLFMRSFILPLDEKRKVQFVATPGDDGSATFGIYGLTPQGGGTPDWLLYVQGALSIDGSFSGGRLDLEEIRARCQSELQGHEFYQQMWKRKIYLGPSAKWIDLIRSTRGEALARMRLPYDGEMDRYSIHPGLADAAFQLIFCALPKDIPSTAIYGLVGLDSFKFTGYDGGRLWCHAVLRPSNSYAESAVADVTLCNDDGEIVAEIQGAHLKRASRQAALNSVAGAGSQVAAAGKPVARRAPAQLNGSRPHAKGASVGDAIRGAGASERMGLLRSAIAQRTASVLGNLSVDFDPQEPLQNLGLDSLMALDLKNALSADLGFNIPLVAFMDNTSVEGLTRHLLPLVVKDHVESAPQASPAAVKLERAASAPTDLAPSLESASPYGAVPTVVPDLENRCSPFPLTDLQQAYLVGRSGAFELGNISTYFFFELEVRDIDIARFERAFQRVIERHDMLHAVILPDGRQQILKEVPKYSIAVADMRGRDPAEIKEKLAATRKEMEEQVFPVHRWPLFDVRATLLDGGITRLHFGFDAILTDARSGSVYLREWAQFYREPEAELPPLSLSFRDYVVALQALEESEPYKRAAHYWQRRIEGLPPAPDLPLDKSPRAVARPRFVHMTGRLDRDVWARFRQRAIDAGVTPSTAFCTAYAEVLATWSKSRHFTLNVLFFNRLPLHPEVQSIVGNFSSTTLLEVDCRTPESFDAKVKRLQRQLWSDLEHSQFSGLRVLRELNRAHGDGSRAGMPVVFASTINLYGLDKDAPVGVTQHLLSMGEDGREICSVIRTPQVWLDHQVYEDNGDIVLNWDVVEELFPKGMIPDMFQVYMQLLHRLADDESAWREVLGVVVPSSQMERRGIVNATAAPIPQGLLHTPFLEAVRKFADRPAVISSKRELSYAELDRRSSRIARWLLDRGARPNALVGVVMEKGWEQIVAVLSILKSGAAYVPIDAGLPTERLHHLLRDAGVELALTQSGVDQRTEWPEEIRRLCVDSSDAESLDAAPVHPAQRPEDLAYVIYTSGSTGVPKGVMIEHRAALNTIVDINQRFGVGPTDRVLALAALNFDLSVYDVFGMLAAGGAVVIPDVSALREPAHWAELLVRHEVTLWNTVPALMEMLTDHLLAGPEQAALSLRTVMMSGDWIPLALPPRIQALLPRAEIYSLGGATEASIWSIFYRIEKVEPSWASIPYGFPMLNQQFHVLDDALRPRPTWVPGHLYIGGIGLARGYWKDETKTRASFINHPVTGERLYRTGDLGRYLPDGSIEFLGREDAQVKVQGYRIELGEIEAALVQQPGVRSAVAAAVGPARGNRRLVAYVVLDPKDGPSTEELRQRLRRMLPEYAVPQTFVVLAALPLSANGKVNRKALPDPVEVAVEEQPAAVEPRDEMERDLVDMWRTLLQVPRVGISDNFFALGGHSLLAVRMMSQIKQRFGRDLPLSTLFENATVERLAGVLRVRAASTGRTALVPIQQGGTSPTLFLVHPVGGDVLCYASLASRLGPGQPVYGLQVPERGPNGGPLTRIEDMAEHYISELRSVQPKGSYRLAGWSMGGVIAFEMARQLRNAGQEVSLLAMIDVAHPADEAERPEIDDETLVSWFARDLGGLAGKELHIDPEVLRRLPGEHQIHHLLAQARRAQVLPHDIDAPTIGAYIERFKRNFRALLSYRPKPYAGDVLLIRAKKQEPRITEGWQSLARGRSAVITIPGDHYSIMREPAVQTWADRLRAHVPVADTAVKVDPSAEAFL